MNIIGEARAERDAEIATMIGREIDKVKMEVEKYGWKSPSNEWHRAFGQIAGLHLALSLIDPDPRS